MTFSELLNNPTGKGTSFVYNRKNIIDDLTSRYFGLLKADKTFNMKVYLVNKKILYYIQVPSENVKSFHYDVAIELQEDIDNTKKTFLECPVRIYSNSPSFIFNGYAYVAKREDILIEWLEAKLNRKSYENPPDIRNPVHTMGFEKSLFFACMYIKENSFYNLENVNLIQATQESVKKDISTFNQKFDEYNAAKEKDKERKVKVVKKTFKNGKVVTSKTTMMSRNQVSALRAMRKTKPTSSMKGMKKTTKAKHI